MIAGWLRAPLLHFLVGGGILFRLLHGPDPFSSVAREEAETPIVVTADDVARLRSAYTRETGLQPTAADERALIDKTIEEELLLREAFARGLDRNDRSVRTWLIEQMGALSDDPDADPDALYEQALALGLDRTDLVVRRILVQKMRLLAARVNERPPTDEELRDFYARHRGEYAPPARVSFWHVFVASGRRRDARGEAQVLVAALRQDGRAPVAAERGGDAFPVPPHLVGQSQAQVAKLFGAEVAARIAAAEPRTWIGPVASPYGEHLVWLERLEPSAPPAFEDVRERVLERWRNEQQRLRVAEMLRGLEARHPLRIESAAWRPRRAS